MPGTDNGEALTLRVDDGGVVHLSAVVLTSGNLRYSTVGHDGVFETSTVARRVSRYPSDAVSATDLQIKRGVPHICFRDAFEGALKVAWLERGAWVLETITREPNLGDGCGIFWQEGHLSIVYARSTGVALAVRMDHGGWLSEDVDRGEGVGVGLAIAGTPAGQVMIASRVSPGGHLRVSEKRPEQPWRSETIEFPVPAGESIRVIPTAGGQSWIAHGVTGNEGSDAGLILTYGAIGAFESLFLRNEYIGGSIGAARLAGQQLGVFTREMRRSAVFGDYDGLRHYDGLPAFAEFTYLAAHDSDQVRHRYRYIDLAADPFGLPVSAFVEERAPHDGDRGRAPLCLLRPSDQDGDKLPDRVEGWLGSDPTNPDSDGDGVSDGDQAMAGRHPVLEGGLPEGVLLGGPDNAAFDPPDQADVGVTADGGMGNGAPMDSGLQSEDMRPATVGEDGSIVSDQGRGQRPNLDGAAPRGDVAIGVQGIRDLGGLGSNPGAPVEAESSNGDGGGCAVTLDSPARGLPIMFLFLWVVMGRRNSVGRREGNGEAVGHGTQSDRRTRRVDSPSARG